MEFHSLILQLNELEETNRIEKARYLAEVSLHSNTKNELGKAQSEIVKLKEEIDQLHEEISSITVQKENDQKIIAQLKQAVKDAKTENVLLRESFEKESLELKDRR